MAKAHQLSFSVLFLFGFLLVLFVSDLACVQGASCNVVAYKENTTCNDQSQHDCYYFCETLVATFQVERVDRIQCTSNAELGTTGCICCLWV
ncbi:hypothetical protein MKW94_019327 [Papaver nudicaule]|uniref:Uncharacterized protein n=1 Tax=Papaver nudicaule TaxID=74823 RepID=A0AA41VRL5_PAPNU|nr:hypothetical protein [Papaver nudicaule]